MTGRRNKGSGEEERRNTRKQKVRGRKGAVKRKKGTLEDRNYERGGQCDSQVGTESHLIRG